MFVTCSSSDYELHELIHYKWYNEEVWHTELEVIKYCVQVSSTPASYMGGSASKYYPEDYQQSVLCFSLSHHVHAFQWIIHNHPQSMA